MMWEVTVKVLVLVMLTTIEMLESWFLVGGGGGRGTLVEQSAQVFWTLQAAFVLD